MKKIMAIVLLMGISYLSLAQIQRESPMQTDSTATTDFNVEEKQQSKYQALQQLNLSEKQKLQLKELRNSFKDKKTTIDNDANLTDEVRSEKLKEIKKSQAAQIRSILTREQKMKLRKIMQENKKQKNVAEEETIME